MGKRDDLLKKYAKDEITAEEVSSWLKQGTKTATEYKRKDSSKYTTDYDSETSSTVKPLLKKADAVWKYLRNHKNEFKNYDELNKQFGAIRNSLTGINAEIDGVNEYYSQWETEEDYNNYVRTSNYEQKHKGKTYGDIQKTIGDLQKKKSEDTQDEIDWLTDYSKTKEVIDTMTKDELKDYVKGIETREAQLNAEKAQLKKANQEVPARYTAEQFKAKTARDARIKKIDEELAGLGNAYYAEDGTAITYDSLYRIKGVEEDIEAIKNNPVLNAAYESILTYEDPLKEDNDIHRMENAMAALSARQDPSIVPNEEYEKDLDYIIKKYRIDITGTDEAIKNEIFNVYNAVGTNSNDIAEAQKRLLADAGYDWEEIKHYRKWQADKEESAKLQESYKIASENYPISSTIGSALFAPARGVDFAIDMYEASKSRDADDDSAYGIANIYDNYAGNMVDTIASEVSENISNDVLEATDSEFLAWLASTGYSGVSSGIQSTLTQAVGNLIAPGFGAFVLGSEAAESQYVEAIKNGSTQSRAAASGVAAGIAEGLFEKYSFDKLVDISYTMDASSFKSFVKSTLSNSFNLNKQGLVESSEELFTSISNAITDNVFNGNHSSYNVSVDKYVRNGMTYDEANKQASIDFGVQLLTDVVGGYAGGVSSSSVKTYVGGAFSAVNNRIEYNNALKQEGKAILDQGGVDTLKALALDIAGEQHGIKNFASKVALERQANKVSGEVYEGKGLGGRISAAVKNSRNAKAVGRLSDTVRTTISEQNMSEIKADLRKQGMSNAEANKIANEFIAVVENGGEFSEELQNAIEKSVEDGTALGETWANVFGKDSAIVARNNRYNLARSGFETDSKGELTEEGKKTATKKMNDKLGITGTVETDAKEFDVNSDGENFSKKSGNAIESLAFVDTEDGIKIKVSDTETVDARDVSYKDATTAAIFSTIATLGADAKTANEIANMFSNITDENQAVYIASDMALAYKYGRMNYGDSYLTKLDSLAPQDAKIIYNKGREQAILHKENEVAKFKSAVEKAKTEKTNGKKVGNLTLAENISTDSKSRTSKENANIMVAEIMSKLTGTEIYVGKSSLDRNGKRTWTLDDGTVVTANGLYLPGKIYLDINAGNFGEGILLETLGHELGHHIKRYNPELFAKIADYLMEEFEKNGYDVRGMIQDEIRKIEAREAREKALAKRNGKPFKAKTEQQIEDEAHEEFVCQAFVGMLQDGTVAKSLADLKQQDYSVWKVIMDTIKDLLEKWGLIIKEYEGRELSTKEGQALASMKDVFKKVQEMYIEGLKGANENFDALGTMNDNVFMLQQRHYNEANPVTGMSGRDTLYEYLENTYGTEDANNLISTIDNINNVMDEIKRDHPELNVFSQWQDTEIDIDENGHPIFTTSINNGDYELNQDFSRVCKKRRQLDFVLNLLAEDPNFEASYLTKEDFVAINNAIKEHGFEIACALCFVDSKRFRQAEWADSFANTWNDILSSLMVDGSNPTPFNFATKSANIADENINLDLSKPITLRKWSNGKVSETRKYDNIEHMLSKAEKNGKMAYIEGNSNIRTIATLIRDNPNLRHTFRGADIISSSGFDSIQKLAPEVRSILDGWGGSSVPKPSSSDASYDNSVLNIKGYNKKAAYAMGGVRMNSFSDFMAHMFFDYCEAFADLSAKQLPMQSYTKELVFARLFGKLGGKINMSGIAAVRKNTLPLTESKKDGITKDQAEKNKEIEKRFAGLDISRLMEHLQKDVSDITAEDLEQNLDLCEYLWADESIDMIKATLLQSGILYDKLSESKQAECYELLKDGKFDKAFKVAGKNNVDTDYAANIGTIVVGVSDAHIRKLLRDNTIRMVIPYHKSGLNPLIANLLKISVYDDYTDFQSTGVVLKGAKKRVNLSSKEIKDSLGLVDFNFYDYFGKTIDGVTYDGSAVADKYLDWCENGVYDAEVGDYVYYTTKDKGYILAKDLHKKLKVVPKFEQFSNELNYYKVLEDFDCYNTITGEHSPQGAVKFLEKGLPEDYKKILTDALIEEQQVQDDFRDHLDNKGLKDEIMDIISKSGYNATDGVGIGKKVSKAEYKEQARELQRKDPTTLTEKELTTLLGYKGHIKKQLKRDSKGRELSKGQQEFFKDSKVRDENGNLLVMYHGTDNGGFTIFDPSKSDDKTSLFLTASKEMAQTYAISSKEISLDGTNNQSGIYSVYANITNPYVVDAKGSNWNKIRTGLNPFSQSTRDIAQKAKRKGYDGVIIKNLVDAGGYSFMSGEKVAPNTVVIAFDSNQIKSVDNANPTSDPDIRYSERDKAYMDAVNNGDMETAQRMVDEVAIKRGFDVDEDGRPDLLFHGTDSFGFTKLDTSQSDDDISFWATPNMGVAGSYYEGSNYRIRRIGKEKIVPKVKKLDYYSSAEQAVNAARSLPNGNNQDLSKAKYVKESEVMKKARKYLNKVTLAAEDVLNGGHSKDIKRIAERVIAASNQGTYGAWQKVINHDSWQRALDVAGISFEAITNAYDTLNDKSSPSKSDISKVATVNSDVFKMMYSFGQVLDNINSDDVVTIRGETAFKSEIIDRYNSEIAEKGIYGFYHKQNNPFIYDCLDSKWNKIPVPNEAKGYFDVETVTTRGLAKWAFENGYDSIKFDNVIDVGGYALSEARYPATIWAFKNPEAQLKSADPVTYDDKGNVIPLSERFNSKNNDIRYQERSYYNRAEQFSYETLTSKPDMKITVVNDTATYKPTPTIRKNIVNQAIKNASSLGKTNENGNIVIRVDDIDTEVLLSKQSLIHGLDRRLAISAPVILNIGSVLKNSIKINELTPDKESASGSYVLIGYAESANNAYPVRMVVNQYTNEVDTIDVLYAVNTKKETVGKMPGSHGNAALPTVSNISISNLLDFVNKYFTDVLPTGVLKHYGYTQRPGGELGQSALFQERDTDTSNRSLLANALESVAQNDIEKNKLAEYKKKISLIESEEQRLSEIQKQLFTKGGVEPSQRKDLQFEAKQIANRINTYDRQLLNLESTTALKNVLNREKALAMKKQKQMDAEYIKQYKEKVQNDKKALVSKYQESRKKAVESRTKTAMRHKIKNVVSELNRMLLKGSKERNVKLDLQNAVASALDAINMDTIGAEERIAKLEQELLKAKTPEKIQEISRKIDNIRGQGDRMSSKLNALKRAYEKIKANDDNLPNYFTEEASLIIGRIEATAEKVGDTPLRYMSLAQLEAVHDLYNLVLTTVRNANKVFVQGKLEDLQHNASATMEELSSIRTLPEERADFGWLRSFSWNEMIPVYAFRRIGSKTFEKFFWEAIRGQNVVAQDLSEANDFAKDTREKYGYKKWDLDKVHEFKLADGRTFRVTLRHMMSIYAYSKRNQALDHMTKGGFFFNDKSTFRKKGGIIKLIKSNEVGYSIDLNTLEAIVNEMTPEQRKYVDDMQTYLTQMGDKGNEVSRVLWGIDIFKEKVYFPLKSVKDFIYQTNQTAQESSLKNDGMTKETKPGASNPIVLEAFDDVWASHVNRMSQYHGLVIPIENLNKIHNYGTWANTESMSVSTMLRARFGEAVNDYLNNFIKDLNGATSVSGASNPFFSFVGKFKKTAVAASASVVVQQPTAIARAAAVMDMKYFIGLPKAKSLSAQWSELQKYAPIAIIKEIGGFDAGAGRQATEWLNSDTRRGIDKIEGKIDDITMKGAAIGDQIGWCTIWEAVKREIKSTTDLKVGSEEFLKKAGERFTEVIVLTQVYDSTLSRSGFMRSKHDSVKMLTAFMGEPTVSINMMADATIQAKRGTITKRKAGRIIGAVYTSIILASIASSLIYGLRDDDEDESYLEKFAEALGGKLLDEINPFNMLPGIRDIISIFDGWDIERTDMAIFKDIKDAFDGLSSDNKSAWRKVEDFTGAIASIFGVPLKNVLRSARETYNAISNIFDDVTPSNVDDAFVRGVTGEKKDKSKSLYDAIINGDDARLEIYRKEYTDDKAYEQAVRKALRDNDPRIKEAAKARYEGDNDEYMRIAKEIKAEGNFSQDTIIAAINAEIDKLKPKTESESSSPAFLTVEDYYKSIINNDTTTALVIKDELVSEKIAEGYLEHEAEDAIASSFTTHIKNEYLDGNIIRSKAIDLISKYGGKTEDGAETEIKKCDFKLEYGLSWGERVRGYRLGKILEIDLMSAVMEIEGEDREGAEAYIDFLDLEVSNPNIDITANDAKGYFKYAEPAGIGVEVYMDYKGQTSGITGDKDANGKTISGSKKAKIMKVINSLPITKSQKDALYYLNGWSARTIYEAPWR